MPLLAQGCTDIESDAFRTGDFDAPDLGPQADPFDPDPFSNNLDILAPLAEFSTAVQIKAALTTQSIVRDEQGCSVPKSLDVGVGDQVRVSRNSDEYALYTVAEKRKQDNPNGVRMGLDARLRIGTSDQFPATLAIPVVATDLTDAQAKAAGELVERLVDDGSNTGLVVIALAVIFFLQNGDYVTIDFWIFEKRTTIRWSILMSIVLGIGLDRLASIWWRRRRSKKDKS